MFTIQDLLGIQVLVNRMATEKAVPARAGLAVAYLKRDLDTALAPFYEQIEIVKGRHAERDADGNPILVAMENGQQGVRIRDAAAFQQEYGSMLMEAIDVRLHTIKYSQFEEAQFSLTPAELLALLDTGIVVDDIAEADVHFHMD